ncbi:MAG: hypothetical protein M1829_003648, partial [Trizodia sp. TS-e1964]
SQCYAMNTFTKRDVAVPSYLSTVPASRITSACSCLITAPVSTSTSVLIVSSTTGTTTTTTLVIIGAPVVSTVSSTTTVVSSVTVGQGLFPQRYV